MVKNRPAETGTGLAGAVAALVVAIVGIENPSIISPLIVVIGAIPSMITWAVNLRRNKDERGS